MDKIKKFLMQVIKFSAVGGLAFIIDYSILYFLTESYGIYYFISAAIAYSVATIFNYIFSMMWVFNVKQSMSKQKQFIIFTLLSLIGLGINQIVMYLSVEKVKVYYLTAKIFSTFIVMIWNFVTKKLCLEKH